MRRGVAVLSASILLLLMGCGGSTPNVKSGGSDSPVPSTPSGQQTTDPGDCGNGANQASGPTSEARPNNSHAVAIEVDTTVGPPEVSQARAWPERVDLTNGDGKVVVTVRASSDVGVWRVVLALQGPGTRLNKWLRLNEGSPSDGVWRTEIPFQHCDWAGEYIGTIYVVDHSKNQERGYVSFSVVGPGGPSIEDH